MGSRPSFPRHRASKPKTPILPGAGIATGSACRVAAMRRGLQAALTRGLRARSALQACTLPAAVSGAAADAQGLPLLAPPPPPAPLRGWRPFTCTAAALADEQAGAQPNQQQQRRSGVDPDSPVGRLARCKTIEVGALRGLHRLRGAARARGHSRPGELSAAPRRLLGRRRCAAGGRSSAPTLGPRSWRPPSGRCTPAVAPVRQRRSRRGASSTCGSCWRWRPTAACR